MYKDKKGNSYDKDAFSTYSEIDDIVLPIIGRIKKVSDNVYQDKDGDRYERDSRITIGEFYRKIK